MRKLRAAQRNIAPSGVGERTQRVIEALLPELSKHIDHAADDGRTALSIACRGA